MSSPSDSEGRVGDDRLVAIIHRFAGRWGLSRREADVLALAAEGRSMKESAAALAIGTKTVEKYWARIYAKVGRVSQLAVVAKLIEQLTERAPLETPPPVRPTGTAPHDSKSNGR